MDGLGRRVLAFDRETGAMLERLVLRPELAAFESTIRERIDVLAGVDDERFARPGSVERDPATGALTVLSEFVSGSRLSDLLETAEEAGLVPGVDVALGFLLEALPAISSFHSLTGHAHGLIAPPRIVLTPAGQVVFLDTAFGSIVERLGLSRSRLWVELGIAVPQGGQVHLDRTADIAQIALSAVMLVIGRRLRDDEFPRRLPSLLTEVVEVAQIRGSSLFATSLQRLLHRSLPLPGRRPFDSADELANEIGLLLRREIGAEVCRQALVDFIEQMDAEFPAARASDPAHAPVAAGNGHGAIDLGNLSLEALDSFEVLDVDDGDQSGSLLTREADGSDEEGFEELPLEGDLVDAATLPPAARFSEAHSEPERVFLAEPEPEPSITPERRAEPAHEFSVGSAADELLESPILEKEVADPWSFDPGAAERLAREPAPALDAHPAPAAQPEPAAWDAGTPDHESETAAAPTASSAAIHTGEEASVPDGVPPVSAPAAEIAPSAGEDRAAASAAQSGSEGRSAGTAPPPVEEAAPEVPVSNSSRRKKRQQKSARARKDKLRSAVAPKPQPQGSSPQPKSQSGWLVNPDRAAAFAPAVQESVAPQPPVVIGHPAPAPVQPAVVAPVAPAVPPVAAPVPPVAVPVVPAAAVPVVPSTPVPMPVYGAPAAVQPAAPSAPVGIRPAPVPQPRPAQSKAPVRLKAEPPAGFTPPRSSAPPPAAGYVQRGPVFVAEEPRRFPWKLALVALVAVAAIVVVGRSYLPSKTAADGEAASGASAPGDAPPAVVVMPKIETGHITIETQPPGARVILDGKPVGQSPLKLADVPVGRHTVRLVSSSGEVTRTVRVEAGKTAVVDASIFSGWVAVFAPIVLDVAVNGRSIGTTERERLMLPAGRHELTLTNAEYGYRSVQQVDVEPGQVRSLTLDPRGTVSFNAVPWGEVWMDGKKLGDTPLANVPVPLGTREFVLKNPAYGERKVTTTVRADKPTAVGVDFTRPQ